MTCSPRQSRARLPIGRMSQPRAWTTAAPSQSRPYMPEMALNSRPSLTASPSAPSGAAATSQMDMNSRVTAPMALPATATDSPGLGPSSVAGLSSTPRSWTPFAHRANSSPTIPITTGASDIVRSFPWLHLGSLEGTGTDRDAGRVERTAHRPAEFAGARGVRVHADRLGVDGHLRAVQGGDDPLADRLAGSLGDDLRSRLELLPPAEHHDLAVGADGPVGEELRDRAQAGLLGRAPHLRAPQGVEEQPLVDPGRGLGDRPRVGRVVQGHRVHRPVRLDVVEADAGVGHELPDRADLVGHVVAQDGLGDLQLAAPEAEQVGEAGMGAHGDPVRDRGLHAVAHDRGVPGVEAAGDVRRRDELHQGRVGAALPQPVALAEIGVEVDRSHWLYPPCPYASARARARRV